MFSCGGFCDFWGGFQHYACGFGWVVFLRFGILDYAVTWCWLSVLLATAVRLLCLVCFDLRFRALLFWFPGFRFAGFSGFCHILILWFVCRDFVDFAVC